MNAPAATENADVKSASESTLPPSDIAWGQVLEQVSAIAQSFLRLVALETKDALGATALAPIIIVIKYALYVVVWFAFSVWISVVVYDQLDSSGSAATFAFLVLQLLALLAVEWTLKRLRRKMRFPYTKACLLALKKDLNL